MAVLSIKPSDVYTRQFFQRLDPGCRRSAQRVVPVVTELIRPESVIDIGCGTGAWLAEFRQCGVKQVLGVDGGWVPCELLHIDANEFVTWDFDGPFHIDREFDLVVSLEFAEHLPESAANDFVASLTSLGNVILFSAAVPGQGGDGHLNEQPLAWWEALFAKHGYCRRDFGKQFDKDEQVEWWYRQNMVFFVRDRQDSSLAELCGCGAKQTVADSRDGVSADGSRCEACVDDVRKRERDSVHREQRVQLDEIQPIVMTCASSMPFVCEFVDSYLRQIGQRLAQPVVVVDLTASNRIPADYLEVLMRLSPKAIHIHPRAVDVSPKDSINDAAFYVLQCGLSELQDRKYLLFVEDDVVFSSQILDYLSTVELDMRTGLLTLYSPGGGYGSAVIEAYRFYGTQCVLFPRDVLQPILDHREEMERRYSPNYDMRWAQWLGSRGYKICATTRSYAQHIGRRSRLGCNFHSSETFVE